jgi:hypothetical protein
MRRKRGLRKQDQRRWPGQKLAEGSVEYRRRADAGPIENAVKLTPKIQVAIRSRREPG